MLFAAPAVAQSADTSRCTNLQQLQLDHAHVLSAEVVPAGAFVAPPRPTGPSEQIPLYKQLAAFCRVKIQATPSDDSNIQIEVWLPVSNWNHRLQGIGNGGFAGEIDFEGMARALDSNSATAGTDTGHFADGIDARWALHHPEKITDYGWRGIHQMTEQAKAVIAAYYGHACRAQLLHRLLRRRTRSAHGGAALSRRLRRHPRRRARLQLDHPAHQRRHRHADPARR